VTSATHHPGTTLTLGIWPIANEFEPVRNATHSAADLRVRGT
jgi:hypothetical protein